MGTDKDYRNQEQPEIKMRTRLAQLVPGPYSVPTELNGELHLQRGILIVSTHHDGDGQYEIELERIGEGIEGLFNVLSPISFKRVLTLNGEGRETGSEVLSVKDDGSKEHLKPGKYHLRLRASGVLICQLGQPEIDQIPQIPNYLRSWMESGGQWYNAIRADRETITIKGNHQGNLSVKMFSFDGDDTRAFGNIKSGSFEHRMTLVAGKEYLIQVCAEKPWNLEFQ